MDENKRDYLAEEGFFHAYIFAGFNDDEFEDEIDKILEKFTLRKADISILSLSENESEVKIDRVRDLIHSLTLSASNKINIGIIVDGDKINKPAANALLKMLEEPPRNTVIILRSDSENVISTVRSRCRLVKKNQQAKESSNTYSYNYIVNSSLRSNFQLVDECVKSNKIETFISDIEADLRQRLLSEISALEILDSLYVLRKRLKSNINKKLAMENFILKVKEAHNV